MVIKARGWGAPRTAEERVAAHYGISVDEARGWLAIHPESELLPARGAGFARGTAAGIGTQTELTGTLVAFGLLGAMAVGVLGLVLWGALGAK